MGEGLRIFLVAEDDSLNRLSVARYKRLVQGDPGERLLDYSGKRVRCAIVVLETAKRVPLSILHVEYPVLSFDADGRIDPAEREKKARLALETLPPLTKQKTSRKIIDGRRFFARRRYDHEFRWTPSPEMQVAIVAAIFDKELA
jgi:hypothetical protein